MYSQGQRNTLKSKALKAAGLKDDLNGTDLPKVMPAHIAAITEDCYADCSSLMTFCGVCGGGGFSYNANGSGNAAVCSGMRPLFTKNNSPDANYVALTDARLLNSPDYLQRGDILISSGHTVMALDCGAKAPELDYSSFTFDSGVGVSNSGLIDITTLKLNTTITEVTKTSIHVKLYVTKFQDGVEKDLEEAEELKEYTWKYYLAPLNTKAKDVRYDTLKISTTTTEHTFRDLEPNKTYVFRVYATKTDDSIKLKSATNIFTTLRDYPTAVRNLSISLNTLETLNKKCDITLSSPSSWGTSSLKKCYRLILFVNGREVAHNDSLLSAYGAIKDKTVYIRQITPGVDLFNYNDVIQLGILPGLKDSHDEFFCDPSALSCSEPFLIENSMKPVDKLYVTANDSIKRVLIYNNREVT